MKDNIIIKNVNNERDNDFGLKDSALYKMKVPEGITFAYNRESMCLFAFITTQPLDKLKVYMENIEPQQIVNTLKKCISDLIKCDLSEGTKEALNGFGELIKDSIQLDNHNAQELDTRSQLVSLLNKVPESVKKLGIKQTLEAMLASMSEEEKEDTSNNMEASTTVQNKNEETFANNLKAFGKSEDEAIEDLRRVYEKRKESMPPMYPVSGDFIQLVKKTIQEGEDTDEFKSKYKEAKEYLKQFARVEGYEEVMMGRKTFCEFLDEHKGMEEARRVNRIVKNLFQYKGMERSNNMNYTFRKFVGELYEGAENLKPESKFKCSGIQFLLSKYGSVENVLKILFEKAVKKYSKSEIIFAVIHPSGEGMGQTPIKVVLEDFLQSKTFDVLRACMSDDIKNILKRIEALEKCSDPLETMVCSYFVERVKSKQVINKICMKISQVIVDALKKNNAPKYLYGTDREDFYSSILINDYAALKDDFINIIRKELSEFRIKDALINAISEILGNGSSLSDLNTLLFRLRRAYYMTYVEEEAQLTDKNNWDKFEKSQKYHRILRKISDRRIQMGAMKVPTSIQERAHSTEDIFDAFDIWKDVEPLEKIAQLKGALSRVRS